VENLKKRISIFLFLFLLLFIPETADAAGVKKGDTMTDGTFNYIVLTPAKKKSDGTVAVYGLNKKIYNSKDSKKNSKKLTVPGRLRYNGGYYDVTATGSSGKATLGGTSSEYQYEWGDVQNLTLPDSITVIGDHSFADAAKLKKITIPSGVTAIGGEAFTGTPLKSVEIPDTVSIIGRAAFWQCEKLVSVTFGEGAVVIGKSAFQGSGIKTLRLPEGCTQMKQAAFSDCAKLKKVVLPASLETMGAGVFAGCQNMESVRVVQGNAEYMSENGIVYTVDGSTLVDGSAADGDFAVREGTQSIGKCAFEGNQKLTSLTLPDSVKTINEGAFLECVELKRAVFGEELSVIGASAFAKCSKLKKINLPDKVKTVKKNAFYQCVSLTSAVLGEHVSSIGSYAFSGCKKLKNAELSDRLKKIDTGAFYGNKKLSAIALPASLSAISGNVFVGCKELNEISVAEENKSYYAEDGMLFNKSGTKLIAYPSAEGDVSIPSEVTQIGAQAFQESMINTVTIPENVVRIEKGAFLNCKELLWVSFQSNEIVLPADVKDDDNTSIAIFYGCFSLQTISAPAAQEDDLLQQTFVERLKKHMDGNGILAWRKED